MISSGFLSVLVLAGTHLFANRQKVLGWVWHGQFLSFASGVSLAYVFVDLLPALAKGAPVLKRAFDPLVPFLELHTYLIALLGILFYYGVQPLSFSKKHQWLSLSSYLLFNFLIGAALSDSLNPEIQPLTLFTIAIGLHYFIRDHEVKIFRSNLLMALSVFSLFIGYGTGYISKIPDAAAATGISFVSGGILLNTLKFLSPTKGLEGYFWFVFGALLYTGILLSVGEVKF